MTVPRETNALSWVRSGQWHETSSCGHYTVSACKVMDQFKFEAWFNSNGKAENLGIFEEAAQGRRVCENHAAKRAGAAA